MKTDGNYVVMDRKVLEGVLAIDWNEEEINDWIEKHQLPFLTIPEFQRDMVQNTVRWFPDMIKDGTIDLNMLLYGLLGEAGECAEAMKKYIRGSIKTSTALTEKLAEESIDLFHYLCLLWVVLEIDPGYVYAQKTQENEKRFGPKDES
jgi:NTP pyrophosphatase (non-canonical NTP hydrolase)